MNQLQIMTPMGEYILEEENGYITRFQQGKTKILKTKSTLLNIASKQLKEYFSGKRTEFDLPLKPQGTDFQKKVWNALLKIPYGQTCSYLDIAKKIKSPKASRAIGGANGKNPIGVIIPCHRVINHNGELGGYSGGMKTKITLLEIENARV